MRVWVRVVAILGRFVCGCAGKELGGPFGGGGAGIKHVHDSYGNIGTFVIRMFAVICVML
jgi:hypothetical protein